MLREGQIKDQHIFFIAKATVKTFVLILILLGCFEIANFKNLQKEMGLLIQRS
jgi:hypothetical protein